MKYDVYYVNSAGEKLDLCTWPYMIYGGDILEYDWSYESTSNYGKAGGKIKNFTKGVEKKSLNITIAGQSEIIYRKAVDALADAIEYDVANLTPGKLFVNGSYIECYVNGIKPDDWVCSCDFLDVELILSVEYPFWLKEKEYVFYKTGQISKNNKRYANRYPWRYPNGQTKGVVYQTFVKPCDFVLTLNGPAVNPSIEVGGKTYGIIGNIDESEYVVIDTRHGFIRKYLNNTEKSVYQNLYDIRTRENDIYEKLPRGTLHITWTGEFRFSIILIEERSLPRWDSQQ